MLLSLKHRIGLFIGVCIGLPLLVCFFPLIVFNSGLPEMLQCRANRQALLAALDQASSIQVIERKDMWWTNVGGGNTKEIVSARVRLTPKQTADLRNLLPLSWGPLTWDSRYLRSFLNLRVTYPISRDHHRIEITQHDGTEIDLTIDFKNGGLWIIQFDKSAQQYDSKAIGTMPTGDASLLRGFISSLGMHPDGPWPEDGTVPEVPK